MIVLCDTCSILLLLRIAPDMFIDTRFECITIQDVRNEFFGTSKFKQKYSWRAQFKNKIQTLGTSLYETKEFNYYYRVIENMIDSFAYTYDKSRNYGLSSVDKRIAACVLANNFKISTSDMDLKDFLYNEFDIQNYSPLKLINLWLKKELIIWTDYHQAIIEDWFNCNEAPQPKKDIREFETLTNYKYIGP